MPFESEAFAKAIIALWGNLEIAKEMGRKGRGWIIKNRNYETLAHEIEKKYFELLDHP